MYGLILNIIAYTLMTFGAYKAMEVSIKDGNYSTRFINFMMFFWNAFMVIYLVKDYDNILAGPFNERLNFFETITNFILAFWLLSFHIDFFKFIKKN
jgi:hypothetical protein